MESPLLRPTSNSNPFTNTPRFLSISSSVTSTKTLSQQEPLTSQNALTAEGKPSGIAPAAVIQNGHIPRGINLGSPVDRLTDIISRYLYYVPDHQFEVTGRSALKQILSRYIERQEAIEIVFPAFPFKSPSGKKVLGAVPDLAEELVLRRLESLAQALEDYHKPGALIRIVSDGIVYGEILRQSDAVLYQYNAGLRAMISEFGLTHITFVRVIDLLDTSSELSTAEMSEEEYVSSIPSVRERFLDHTVAGFDVDSALKSDYGTLMTYRGYLKFLTADLEGTRVMKGPNGERLSQKGQERVRRTIARTMLGNGAKFSDLVARRFPHAVRISCHAHDNSGPKYAFNMFPGTSAGSPWHNTVIEREDGSLSIGHFSSFDPSTYEVVHRNGRPYHLREHSSARDLGPGINPHVTFTRNFPFGLILSADPSANLSLTDLPMAKIRALSIRYSFILLRGFGAANRDELIRKSGEFGKIVTWPAYGALLEIKENPSFDINSSLTSESMPMHYDGCFKTTRGADGELTHDPPNFQIFQCVSAPSEAEGGKTLLTNTADLLRQSLTAPQREWLSQTTWSVYTPQNTVFGGDHLRLPLVMRNEATGHDILRWHESWPQHVTKYKPTETSIDGVSREDSVAIGDYLTDLLFDRRFCYAHTWTTGEYLIADNIELMHTRTAFEPCLRELWRIHAN